MDRGLTTHHGNCCCVACLRQLPSGGALDDVIGDVARLLAAWLQSHVDAGRTGEALPRSTAQAIRDLAEALGLMLEPPHGLPGTPNPAASGLDPYMQDLIDPEFGLAPARESIRAAARRILAGDGVRHRVRGGRSPAHRASGGSDDESS